MFTPKRLIGGSQGVVSLVVTMVLAIVITLIVLGFAEVSRHNQREATDRQLSAQAYYAAETGINDAYKAIKANQITTANTNNCTLYTTGGGVLAGKNILSPDQTVSYTCLLVNPAPNTLSYSGYPAGSSFVVPLVPASGTSVNNVTVTWNPSRTTSGLFCGNAVGTFTDNATWDSGCPYAMLQVDLVPTSGALTSGGLIGSQQSYYFQPTAVGAGNNGDVAASAPAPANITGANCSASLCSASITGLGQSQYYMRIGVMYEDIPSNGQIQVCVNVATSPSGNCNGATESLQGAQAMIDSTGKAQDELRRIQVRVQLTSSGVNVPGNALESNSSICKQLSVGPSPIPYNSSCP